MGLIAPATKTPAETPAETIIVSGLPRSGTSMVMQMLDAGGVELLADDERPPDILNPNGYFEYAPVKSLASGGDWIADAAGRAVKVVAPLICQLPPDLPYAIVFIRRRLSDVLASQERMIRFRCGHSGVATDWSGILRHDEEISIDWSVLQSPDRIMILHYEECREFPLRTALEIEQFLGRTLDVQKMSDVIGNIPGHYLPATGLS